MNKEAHRMSITLLPEWDEDIKSLKKEVFYDKTKSELIRFLIQTGIDKMKESKNEHPKQPA